MFLPKLETLRELILELFIFSGPKRKIHVNAFMFVKVMQEVSIVLLLHQKIKR